MEKSIKEKLKKKQERDRREYRDELLKDLNVFFEDWKKHSGYAHQKGYHRRKDAVEKMRKIKKEQTFEFLGACLFSSLLGSILAIVIYSYL